MIKPILVMKNGIQKKIQKILYHFGDPKELNSAQNFFLIFVQYPPFKYLYQLLMDYDVYVLFETYHWSMYVW